MRIAFDFDGQRMIRDIHAADDSTTLQDLLIKVGLADTLAADIYIDDTRTELDAPLNEVKLLEGSVISSRPNTMAADFSGWTASISGGLSSGEIIELPRHRRVLLGRSPHADIRLETQSASWEHASFEVENDDQSGSAVRIRDSESTNGTFVNGETVPSDEDGTLISDTAIITVGGVSILLRPDFSEHKAPKPGSLHNLTSSHTAPFNRPPRPGRPAEHPPATVPERKTVPPASKFSYVTVIAPLLMAGAMVMMMGNARYALFALLSPVMAIGMWFEQKRRHKKNLAEEEARFSQALLEFKDQLAQTSAQEAARLREWVPDTTVVMRTARFPTTRLWQRRAQDEEVLALNAGTGENYWKPELPRGTNVSRLDKEARAIYEANKLAAAPVIADLSNAGVVGIVGNRQGALALARSLVVQAATHIGPADLRIAVFCDRGRADSWGFTSWLPHTRRHGSNDQELWLSDQNERSKALLKDLKAATDATIPGLTLMVVDSEVLTEGRDAPARSLLGHGRSVETGYKSPGPAMHKISGIVIATEEHYLPAACNTVIHVRDDAEATVEQRHAQQSVDNVTISGLSEACAEHAAQDLARFDDPELVVPGAGLPSLAKLPDLLGLQQINAGQIRKLWASSKGFETPIGISEAGIMSLDLVKDGPHGLVGGTTGSGKSEFLRSMVAGLAARNAPDKLNFILVDFKGGAAFAACEALPHTIGTISNLDEQLATRALESLEAEMERRQRLFAAAGEDIDNLDAYLKTDPEEPMPRLLLVIDEFAMLAKEFPDVLKSLVSVGAVGRTLGVHMILATQRPAGVVTEDILANTNLRVALRVQSREDSNNVIGVPAAASISRKQMGRSYVKLGQDDITAVQTALVTGRAVISSGPTLQALEPGHFGSAGTTPVNTNTVLSQDSDLDLLIEAINEANDELGLKKPRFVWPEALGQRVELQGFESVSGTGVEAIHTAGGFEDDILKVALRDEPQLQRQTATGWNLREGNLLLVGIPGSGTSTTLCSLALTAALNVDPDELDLMVLDLGAGALRPLAHLPHTLAYVGTDQGSKERQARFLRFVGNELSARKADPRRRKKTVILVDGFVALREEFDAYGSAGSLMEQFMRAYAEGPALGLHFAVTSSINNRVPTAMNAITTQKWVFKLSDYHEYSALGIKKGNVPAPVPGRCVSINELLQMHVASVNADLSDAVALIDERWGHRPARPPVIRNLPTELTPAQLGAVPSLTGEPWKIPVGISESDLSPVFLEIYPQEHVLIGGPARSGKSTLLMALAQLLQEVPVGGLQHPEVWAICDKRSPLSAAGLDKVCATNGDISGFVNDLLFLDGPRFLLIDDVEKLDDQGSAIENLLKSGPEGVCVIAAGRSAELRSLYSWQKILRSYGTGVLLQPDPYKDQPIFGIDMPGKTPVALTPGRGYAHSGGHITLIQSISPSAPEHKGATTDHQFL
ncbi:FtsK/SpoIIIE domain-containing protein [Glutamicibacter sp. JC586]|uniref:FtsK/SpoIIIE domain-containing protein n=1 Tax=Glutamicibacter sp. JC586 TaxID=2590552 RepID=UPI001358DF23|nr:FtsK/SpoIIIE domain-containing protein [Glutamicibacter sp. JC586]